MKVNLLIFVLALVLFLFIPAGVMAASEAEVLKDIFRKESVSLGPLFADSFLEQVSLNQIEAIVNQYGSALGAVQAAEKTENGYSLQFEKGTAPAQITLNSEDKIIGLWFGNYSLAEDNLDTILAELKELPGELSISVIKNNQEKILSYNDQKLMAVGSTFKLHVLKKLYKEIEEGLSEENIPFLTTREFFILKFSDDDQLRERYLNSNLKEKRESLNELSSRELNNIKVGDKPILIENLEWYFSTEELSKIIYELRDAPEIKINSGLVDKTEKNMFALKTKLEKKSFEVHTINLPLTFKKLELAAASDFEMAAIAGNKSNLFLGRLLIKENDGRIRVKSVKIPGLKDFIVLPYGHKDIHFQEETADLVAEFLESGSFNGGDKNGV